MGVGGSTPELRPIISAEEAQERVPAEWLETIQLMFQEMTKHSDLQGQISKGQFEDFYGTKTVRMLGPLFDRLFEVLDVDGDGTVSYEEFLAGMCIFAKGTREEKLKLLFKVYDLNGDGFISQEEFVQMLRGSIMSAQAAMAALLLTEEKDYKDLMSSVKNNLKDSGPRFEYLAEKIFKESDLNNDGKLSFSEFSVWAEKNMNFNEYLEKFMPDQLEKRLKGVNALSSEKEEDMFPLEKEAETLAVTATSLNRATARFVRIESDGRTVTYTGKGRDLRATGGHQSGAIHPVNFVPVGKSPFYYFELVVIEAGVNNENAIGFYPADTVLRGVPGWYNDSYGYHSDEGCRYHALKPTKFVEEGIEMEKVWQTGDVVGAGIKGSTIFFTLNGKLLRPFFEGVKGAYYPIVAFTSPGASGRLNFGEEPFVWKGQGEEEIGVEAGMASPSPKKKLPDLKVSTSQVSVPFSAFDK